MYLTREESLSEIYGEHWDSFKDNVDDKGFPTKPREYYNADLSYDEINEIINNLEVLNYNNGWKPYPNDSDVNEHLPFWVINTLGELSLVRVIDELPDNPLYYKDIITPDLPIYIV
jgi:hypothetical protein